MNALRSFRLGGLLLLAALFAGCASYEARWKSAAKSPGVSRWEGRWASEKHAAPGGGLAGGRLRAILTEAQSTRAANESRTNASPPLRADFRANWSIFATNYTATLQPVPGSRTRYEGSHELPKIFGGTYRYTARIAGNDFAARYTSRYDDGTFALQRVPAPKVSAAAHARH